MLNYIQSALLSGGTLTTRKMRKTTKLIMIRSYQSDHDLAACPAARRGRTSATISSTSGR